MSYGRQWEILEQKRKEKEGIYKNKNGTDILRNY